MWRWGNAQLIGVWEVPTIAILRAGTSTERLWQNDEIPQAKSKNFTTSIPILHHIPGQGCKESPQQ